MESDTRPLNLGQERELLVALIEELDAPAGPRVDKEWLAEVQRRYRELVKGKVKGMPGDEVFERLRSRLGR